MHIESGERRVRHPPRAGGRRRVAARTQCTGCSLGCGTMCTQWRPRRGGARGTAGRSGGGGCGAAGAGTSAAMRAHRSKPPLAPRPRGEGGRWQSTSICVARVEWGASTSEGDSGSAGRRGMYDSGIVVARRNTRPTTAAGRRPAPGAAGKRSGGDASVARDLQMRQCHRGEHE